MARDAINHTPARSAYINKCDLCPEIRTQFAPHNFGSPAELNPKAFYERI
ncbi:MAG: hypothetical protein JRE62_04540 [Deltaproteobacteria bacterium]|jgi:hypothetical protein|nr:hypothetical protein [Deltaproteobacteria bacterium]